MKLRSCTCSLAILACVALLRVSPALAQVSGAQARSDCQDQPSWSQERLAKFDAALASFEQDVAKRQAVTQAIYWAQDRLTDFDAAIANLEQDIAALHANARAKAETLLNDVRDRRDAYRVKVRDITTSAQAAAAGKSLDEAANAFWTEVDAYLDAIHADIGIQQAAMQTRYLGN